MKTFHLSVAKVGEQLFEGDAASVSLPGSEGVFQVLADHEPFVSRLSPGKIHIVDASGQSHQLEITESGIAEVSLGETTVLL